MRRALAAFGLLLILAGTAFGWPLARLWKGGLPWWNNSSLTFWAPLSDPSAPLTLYKGTGSLTFTRAHDATHTATYVHPGTGLLTVADNNALRIEANGALIEGARTNSLVSSSAGFVSAQQGTISANVLAAPDGAVAAEGFTESTASATHYDYFNALSLVSNNTIYAWSTYLKTGLRTWTRTGTSTKSGLTMQVNYNLGSVAVGTVSGTGTLTGYGISGVAGGWIRPWYSWDVLTGTPGDLATNIQMAKGNGDYSYAGDNSAIALYGWGRQLEAGAFPSSSIPTVATAMTRNADVLTVATSGNIDNAAGTLAVKWTPQWASTDAVGSPVLWDAGGLKAWYQASDDKLYFTDGTNTISTAALTFSANVAQKLAFRWGTGGLDIYRNGAEAATGATFTEPALNVNLYIGSDTSGANQAYSNFKTGRGWSLELSDAGMGSITQ